VTRGLLQTLDRDELQGVIAHEMSHTRNYDDRGGGAAGIIFFVVRAAAVVVAPLLAQMPAMMVSRRREYLADASGADLTRNPLGLANALAKIDAVVPTQVINRGSAHLCIADPLGRPVNLKSGRWSDLFASHPPMAARIAALKEMAFQGGGR
jgi:heat shock protein HtpX